MATIEQLRQQIKNLEQQVEQQQQTIAALQGDKKAKHDGGTRHGSQAKTLQAALKKAEQANRIKSEFIENVSHEIRTSMNSIIGLTSLVLETELTEEQERYLQMVTTSVDRLLEVVSEVLDFSKIETGVLELQQLDFNLKESLDHDLYVLKLEAEKKKLFLTCEIAPDVPDIIYGDPKRLVQIVANSVHESIKHTEKGGVRILVKNTGYDASNRIILQFVIEDSRPGYDAERLQQIEQTFRSGESLAVMAAEGVGLGMAVSARLASLMGGELHVDTSNKNVAFIFSLPFREVVDSESEEQETLSSLMPEEEMSLYALQGAKILLAEDEAINRILLEAILAQAGAEVISVSDGEKAVQEAAKGECQVILMDVQMPGYDGLEATRAIRKLEKKKDRKRIPIIAITAHALEGDREKCLQAGMDDYCSKPIDKNQLLTLLARYLTPKALVVDSDLDSRHLILRFLVENGWGVTLAETARLAMYEASLAHFDLIFLDAQMPKMDAVEIAQIIRKLEQYTGQHAMMIGLGGESMEEQKCMYGGIDTCLFRPVTTEKLMEKLQELKLERKR